MLLIRRVIWWIIKIACGAAAVIGAVFVAYSLALLFNLLTGRVYPDFETPDVRSASFMLVLGVLHLAFGILVPKLFKIDRLL